MQTVSSLNTVRSAIILCSCYSMCFKAEVTLASLFCATSACIKSNPAQKPTKVVSLKTSSAPAMKKTVGEPHHCNTLLQRLPDSRSLLCPISNSPLRGFTPPSTKSCLLGQGGIPGVNWDRWLSPQGMYVGAGKLNAEVIRDKSRQKHCVISVVWVYNCCLCKMFSGEEHIKYKHQALFFSSQTSTPWISENKVQKH